MANDNSNGGKRLASAMARAARGAALGGLHGAAVGIAREFAPEIFKTLGIILITLIVIPILIFTALPNILFGFESSTKSEITEFTSLANVLNTEYGEVGGYAETEADGLLESILEQLGSNEEIVYDDVETTRNLTNLNESWFIAITSVANNQDLFTIDSSTIKNMVSLKIDSKWEIVEKVINEDEDESTIQLLKIEVYDITPEALMDKLDFTDEQRNWARVLYSTLVQEQNLTPADGDIYYGTDYGNIVFTDAAVNVVYYNQSDSRWGGKPYGKTRTIAAAGCGPTALAMAVATLADSSVTPEDVATWGAGYYVQDQGSSRTLITEGGAHYGLTVTGLGMDAQKVADALGRGNLVIAIMVKGHFTKSGHFILLRGITSDGNILVADPGSVTRSNQEWSLRLIANEVGRSSYAGGPFWELSA